MKVFLSWSGEISHKVAVILREWIPSVIQSVEPYVSSEDIDKGTRWSTDIAKELEQSLFGILCITRDNILAPWINFEAGALSKAVEKSRVCPFLFNIKRTEINGPILQFQSTIFESEDILKLIKAINLACGAQRIDETKLEKAFEVWWPLLQKELDGLQKSTAKIEHEILPPVKHEPVQKQIEKMVEEVLELTRVNHKILRNPVELFPPHYIRDMVEMTGRRHIENDHPVHADLINCYRELKDSVVRNREKGNATIPIEEIEKLMIRLSLPIEYIENNFPGLARFRHRKASNKDSL